MVVIIDRYHNDKRKTMDTARIFQSGRSQAIRLPKEYRFTGTEVKVKHVGNAVLLMPSDQPWGILPTALSLFEPGFTIERSQPDEQLRATLLP
jgi:antitoxin VapB